METQECVSVPHYAQVQELVAVVSIKACRAPDAEVDNDIQFDNDIQMRNEGKISLCTNQKRYAMAMIFLAWYTLGAWTTPNPRRALKKVDAKSRPG